MIDNYLKGVLMFTQKMPPIRYYETFQDEFVESSNQKYQIDADYDWERESKFWQKVAIFFTFGLAKFLGWMYRFLFHVNIENRTILGKYQHQSYYVYGNHTQPQGDAFMPFQIIRRRYFTTIASPANLGISILGKLLPYGGAIPTPVNKEQMKQFIQTMKKRRRKGQPFVIYPEEHVWPYYTKIRPFNVSAFHYPAVQNDLVFCMTTTYQRRRFGKRPKQTIYIDGPFVASDDLSLHERQVSLKNQVEACMNQRSQLSTYDYIQYKRRES